LEPELTLRPMVLLAGTALLILSEVFRQGAVMRADLETDPGARLLLFTDGISEAANPADEEFGDERLARFLDEQPAASPRELLSGIADAVAAFCSGAPQADDMTMMVVCRAE